MSIVTPDCGEVRLLGWALNNVTQQNQTLKLFVNDVTPDDDTVVGDFTECTATGYAAKTLTKGSWTVATAVGVTSATYATQTFTITALTADCYGYYVIDANAGTLLWCERFSSSEPLYAGKSISIVPYIELT